MKCSDTHYALNEKDELIHIDAAHREAQYRCPYCGALMTPHIKGEKHCRHFEHKPNTENCSYETYLHKIAKIKIREAFLNAQEFFIWFEAPAICNNKDCEIRSENPCEFKGESKHNLKEFYDSCKEEQQYKNFVADLLLTSSTYPEDPILIEIFVSHKCTDEKINDGVRIIEIQIQSEEDIEAIVSSCRIEENKGPFIQAEKPSVTFYHFHPTKKQELPPPEDFNVIYYLYMYDSGYFKGGQYYCTEKCPIPATAHYIVSPFRFNWDWAFLEFKNRGVDVKNCLICKYRSGTSDRRICTLYKEYGTPRQPKTTTAKQCQYFRPILKALMICVTENIEYCLDFIKKQELDPEYNFVIRKK